MNYVGAGCTSITQPNYDVTFQSGRLVLAKPSSKIGPKPNINLLFNSLAEELGAKAIVIILSGTGTDGAIGCMSVKAAGGTVIIQSPEDAKYDGMPRAVMQKGFPVISLTSDKIGEILEGNPATLDALNLDQSNWDASTSYTPVLDILKNQLSIDLSQYKFNTIQRRIYRRMNLLGIQTPLDYAKHLQDSRHELQQLGRDVLISVTAFFRDKTAFNKLQETLSQQLDNFTAEQTFRVWVAGCATGEEAYSIAIIINEIAKQQQKAIHFRIFATDIDRVVIQQARKGIYTSHLVEQLPEHIINQYFTPGNGPSYRVNQKVRDRVVFAEHNVISDAPFSNLQLISCRNLLIYFSSKLQQTVIERFHYGLIDNGLLFLGKSEHISHNLELFTSIEKKAKLFRKQAHYSVSVPAINTHTKAITCPTLQSAVQAIPEPSIENQLGKLLGGRKTALVVVSDNNTVLYLNEDAQPFLNLPSGLFGKSIFRLVLPELRATTRANKTCLLIIKLSTRMRCYLLTSTSSKLSMIPVVIRQVISY